MKKRMMAMLMAAMMIIASIPFTAFAEEMPAEVLGGEVMEAVAAEAAEAEAVPAAAGEEAEAAEETLLGGTVSIWSHLQDAVATEDGESGVTGYLEWKKVDGVMTVKLLNDIICDDLSLGPVRVPEGRIVVLDLNGHNIIKDSEGAHGGNCITVNGGGAALTIKDESAVTHKFKVGDDGLWILDAAGEKTLTGGCIMGLNPDEGNIDGIGVFINGGGTLNLYGGNIVGNKASRYGGGVNVCGNAVFNIYGGSVIGNTAGDNGGGVCVDGELNVYGGNISENTLIGGTTANNVYLKDGKYITIGDDCSSKTNIGVTTETAPAAGNPVKITTNGTADDLAYFFPDVSKYGVGYHTDGGYLELQYPGLSITSDKSSYNFGDRIRLAVTTTFVPEGTRVTITEGQHEWGVPVKNGSGAIIVNALETGVFEYKASIEYLGLNDTVEVTVKEKPEVTIAADKTVYTAGDPITFTLTAKNLVDGNYSLSGDLDGKMITGLNVNLKDGTASLTMKSSNLSKGKHVFSIMLQGGTASANFEVKEKEDPKPDPAPSSDDSSQALFTGTWGNPVTNGAWSLDANGIWHYTTTRRFANTWAYIYNPYAHDGQNTSDWFRFDEKGNMLTGWQMVNGKWYYLHPNKDGVLGSCLLGPGKTPDGWEIDETGAWTGR